MNHISARDVVILKLGFAAVILLLACCALATAKVWQEQAATNAAARLEKTEYQKQVDRNTARGDRLELQFTVFQRFVAETMQERDPQHFEEWRQTTESLTKVIAEEAKKHPELYQEVIKNAR